jgi:hypothetical protein
MARSSKKTSSKRPRSKASAPNAVGIVVRRGARRRFDALTQKTADLPAVVLWDRRQVDRRGSPEPAPVNQRKIERRRPPSYTWEVADFVVVDPTQPQTHKGKLPN